MKKILVSATLAASLAFGTFAAEKQTDLQVASNYLSVIGYDSSDFEYPILKEATEHYFNNNQLPLSVADMKEAKAVIAFSFGMLTIDGKESAGPANEGMGKIVADLNKVTNLPVYAQWEISEAAAANENFNVDYAVYPKDGYLSTVGVIEQLEANKSIKKGDTLILVANYDHGFRVRKLLEKQGYKVLFGTNSYIPNGGWMNQFDVDDEYGYFYESSQVWTKSRANFISEEIYWLVNELHGDRL